MLESVHNWSRDSLGDIRNDKRCEFDVVFANDIDRAVIQGVINRIT
jgi:hypothetical protein